MEGRGGRGWSVAGAQWPPGRLLRNRLCEIRAGAAGTFPLARHQAVALRAGARSRDLDPGPALGSAPGGAEAPRAVPRAPGRVGGCWRGGFGEESRPLTHPGPRGPHRVLSPSRVVGRSGRTRAPGREPPRGSPAGRGGGPPSHWPAGTTRGKLPREKVICAPGREAWPAHRPLQPHPHHPSAHPKAQIRLCYQRGTRAGLCPGPRCGRRRPGQNTAYPSPAPCAADARARCGCVQPALAPCATLEAGLGTSAHSSTKHPFTPDFSKSCSFFFFFLRLIEETK